MNNKKRIVVVGLGSIGRRHARLLKERNDVAVELFELDTEAIAGALKEIGDIPVHNSFNGMLATRPYAVVIATPHKLHAEQTIRSLEAETHVFCEKPMSDNLCDAKRMQEAAEKAGKILAIGFQLHFHPGLMRLKSLLQEQIIGNVLHTHVRVGTYITLVNSKSRYQRRQHGALLFDYAHQPDILYWLLGDKPTAVYASAIEGGELEFSSNPNVVAITCEYNSLLLSTIHLNYVQMPERHEYEIIGDKGWIVLNCNESYLKIALAADGQIRTESFTVDRDALYRSEHTAFLDAAEGRRSPESSANDGLVSVAVCQAAFNSWKNGQCEKVAI
jgi:UDP-N-acetylglucosamine 3-dehydrogenase